MIVAPLLLAHHGIEFLRVEIAEIDRMAGLLQAGERLAPDHRVERFGQGVAVDVENPHASSRATQRSEGDPGSITTSFAIHRRSRGYGSRLSLRSAGMTVSYCFTGTYVRILPGLSNP